MAKGDLLYSAKSSFAAATSKTVTFSGTPADGSLIVLAGATGEYQETTTPSGFTAFGGATNLYPGSYLFAKVASSEGGAEYTVTFSEGSSTYEVFGFVFEGSFSDLTDAVGYLHARTDNVTTRTAPNNVDLGGNSLVVSVCGSAYGDSQPTFSWSSPMTSSSSTFSVTVTGSVSSNLELRTLTIPLGSAATGPTFTTAPTVTARTTNSYTIGGTLSAEGEVYAVAVLSTDTAPTTEAQIVAGNNGSNAAARGAGNAATNAQGAFSFNITGTNLSDNVTHNIHVVGRAPEA
jgi:hypothetical protein